jgi:hypothetical protein
MKKLTAYRKAEAELAILFEERKALNEEINKIRFIEISTSLSITVNSTDKQYLYAVGLLNNQIATANELGIDATEYLEKKETVVNYRKLTQKKAELDTYYNELHKYKCDTYDLLSNTELFALKVYPVRKK